MTALPRRTRLAALALTAALVPVLAGCGDDEPTTEATDPADSSATPTPSDPATSASPTEASSAPAEQVTVPVYFVGDTPQGPRLFREFRQVPAADPLGEAVALMTAGDAMDPDYRTAYPSGSFASVSYADGGFDVALADDAWSTPEDLAASDEATLAVQQLVYTAQGVQQDRAPVTVTLDGSPTTLFGVDTAAGVKAADELDTLSLVNVTAPEQGATVSGTLTASGVANSPEANVPWEVRQGDKVVLDGFATAEGWMDKLYPWQAEVDLSGLEPGEYTFVAMTDDASGGAEGNGPQQDTKTFTIG